MYIKTLEHMLLHEFEPMAACVVLHLLNWENT